MGNTGRAAAARARPFGVPVVAVKRTVREEDEAWEYADELYATRTLHKAIR
jgi:phosphoglycerate dehydrogenase-like enzyme